MSPEDNPQNWHYQKTYESMISYGLNAIKFVLLANGGAILAILTFIGNHQEKASNLKWPVFCFVLGSILGGFVNITAYVTQLSLFNQRADDVPLHHDHRTWLWLSVGLISLGVLCFSIGSIWAVFELS